MADIFPSGAWLAAYVRDSGGAEQDLSITQQLEAIGEWCREHGYVLSKVFKDEARKGSSAVGREAFNAMMDHFDAGNVREAGVVIWKFARFARSMDDSQYYKSKLRRQGYNIYAMMDIIPEGRVGRLIENIHEYNDEVYRKNLSDEVKRGQRFAVHNYKAFMGPHPPKGYLRVQVQIGDHRHGQPHFISVLEPDPDLLDIVRKAWQMRAQGYSYLDIHRAVNLHASTPRYSAMFHNRLYIGELERDGEVVENFCEPIVDRATWDMVQEINREWAQKKGSYPAVRASSQFLLSGMVFCKICGSPMLSKKTYNYSRRTRQRLKGYDYYSCIHNNGALLTANCPARRIPRQQLEDEVLDLLTRTLLLPEALSQISRQVRESIEQESSLLRRRQAEYNKELAGLESEINRIVAAIGAAGHSEALIARLSKLEELRGLLRSREPEIAALSPSTLQLPPDEEIQAQALQIALDLKNSDLAEKKRIIRKLVVRVSVLRDAQGEIQGKCIMVPPPPLPGVEFSVTV